MPSKTAKALIDVDEALLVVVPEPEGEPEVPELIGAAAPETDGVPCVGPAVAMAAMPPETKLVFETLLIMNIVSD